jgi:Rrf2 family cysteine metabolism transcriptional repressor
MRISLKQEYALRAVFDLAAQPSGAPVKMAQIARRQKIPQKFLELILAGLKQAGFVESRRGAEGGYLLARPADRITAGEVLRFVEGSTSLKPGGPRQAVTPFSQMWREVDEAISSIVDRATFAELVREWAERRAQDVPSWEI